MSNTGRYFVIDLTTGKSVCVEPIDNAQRPADWGDIDVVSKKLTGHYGEKSHGSIKEGDSIITEENGFKNITTLSAGENPEDEIKKLDEDENRVNRHV